ncbi:MAG: HPr(Ser) kinase/phosphatase [Candidatus Cloacimonadota bacterium]|nr:MAG: HPr(Ser) kinase/phosphatase [Candidatus Cloacimonadota bacterium]
MNKKILVKKLFEDNKNELSLSVLTKPDTLNNIIETQYLHKPGLALSGYLEHFAYKRIQILGETEISYLQNFSEDEIYEKIKTVFEFDIPCLIVSKGLSIPYQIEFLANDLNIAVLSSRLSTDKLYRSLEKYLDYSFAPEKIMHATMVDVFGVGILITGKSGIGKSECALDLVERGHRLIADDLVKIKLQDDKLTGTLSREIGHFLEVRGVGIVDIQKMFGIQAVGLNKTIETEVVLMPWHENLDYERVGQKNNYSSYFEKNIPLINLPVSPGKNVSVIIEVIALNHILKTFGYNSAEVFMRRLEEATQKGNIN